jgi:hypothetical protein
MSLATSLLPIHGSLTAMKVWADSSSSTVNLLLLVLGLFVKPVLPSIKVAGTWRRASSQCHISNAAIQAPCGSWSLG